MQNAALRTATGCTQDTNIQHLHDETLTLPIHEHLQLHASQYKQKTQHPSHPPHNILQHSKAKKNTIFNNDRYTTNIPTDPHTVTTTDIKTNMRHIHTSIVSRHLATSHTYTKSTPKHIHHHYAPSVTSTHTTHIISSTTPTTLSPLDLWTDPAGVTALLARWTEKLASGPQAGTSDSPH